METDRTSRVAELFAELAASRGMLDLWQQVWNEMSPEAKQPLADRIGAALVKTDLSSYQMEQLLNARITEVADEWYAANKEALNARIVDELQKTMSRRIEVVVSNLSTEIGQKQYDDAMEVLRRRRDEYVEAARRKGR